MSQELQSKTRWRVADVVALYDLPFNDLLFRAQTVHREHFDPNAVQLSTLLSIKTSGCEEDCTYCPQSVHHDTGLKAEKLMDLDEVLKAAEIAKANGATRFCMGAAWRNPKGRYLEPIKDMIRGVKSMGLETCVTLGMLEAHQAQGLRDAGLDYYNHNLDTSPEFYSQIISTHVSGPARHAGTRARCMHQHQRVLRRHRRHGRIAARARRADFPTGEHGAVSGIGADQQSHAGRGHRGAGSVRIRVYDRGGAHHDAEGEVRLSAGRERMDEALQALCFAAGANSIFYGDQLLRMSNPQAEADRKLLERLGMRAEAVQDTGVQHAERSCGHAHAQEHTH